MPRMATREPTPWPPALSAQLKQMDDDTLDGKYPDATDAPAACRRPPRDASSAGSEMDFNLSTDEQAFRDELRAWLAVHCPRDWAKIRPTLGRDEQARALIDWQRLLHAAGYVGLHWPVAHGGRGATVIEQAVFYEEMARARAPELANAIGLDMAGPAIIVHGTDEQKA